MKRYLHILVFAPLFLISTFSFSQTKGILRGVIRNDAGEVVTNANIFVEGTNNGVVSDDDGFYEIQLPSDTTVLVEITHVAHQSWFQQVQLSSEEVLILNPVLKTREIEGVVIEDKRLRQTMMQTMPVITHRRNPSVNQGIESVLLSGLGVSVGSELGTGYSVRGGSFDENLVYVNDVEVYRPFLARAGQQEGLSFPNPDMVGSITFSAGGFEAKYGDKMSSVLDIKYKEPEKFGGAVTASLLGGAVTLESSSDNHRLTQITGFRYLSNQYILGSLDTQGDYKPSFADLQSYWTYDLSEKVEISFLGNYSNNRFNFIPQTRQTDFGTIQEALRFTVFFEGQEVTQFETFFGALSLDYRPSNTSLLKFTTSAYQTYEEESFDILGAYRLDELERNLGSDQFGEVTGSRGTGGFLQHARNSLDAFVSSFNHRGFSEMGNRYLQWGAKIQREIINDKVNEWDLVDSAGYSVPHNPGEDIMLQNTINAKHSLESIRYTGFLQNTWEFRRENSSEFSLTAGLRGQYWDFNNETVISPRGMVTYRPNWEYDSKKSGEREKYDIVFKFASGYYYQPAFYREMRRFDGTINTDIKAQRSIHFILGADLNFLIWDRTFKFMSEAYYKKLDALVPYEVDNVRLRYFGENIASGYATGIDFKINGEFVPGVESWATLSFMKTAEDLFNDSFTQLIGPDGKIVAPGTRPELVADTLTIYPGEIPRPNDRRVFFSLFFQDEMPSIPSLRVNLSFVYGTGLPFGPPSQNRHEDVATMPSYRRVDIGFSKVFIEEGQEVKSKTFGFLKGAWVSVEVFNLFGVNNTISYTWIRDARNTEYAIPNFLTSRRVNVKVNFTF